MIVKIKRFGDTRPYTHSWIEIEGQQERKTVSEEIIDAIWWEWIIYDGAERQDDEHNIIFAFTLYPLEIDINI